MKPKPRSRFYTKLLLTSVFLLSGSLSLAQLALAAGTPAGTLIENKATGSFEGNTSNTPGTVTSNTVTLQVQEVAGISVVKIGTTEPSAAALIVASSGSTAGFPGVNPGPYQDDTNITKGDVWYYDFTITNTGNSPTAIFIPGIATITGTGGGIQRGIKVIEVDPDGAGAAAAIPLSVAVPSGGGITTDAGFLGASNGYIPVNGTVKVRVAVELGKTTPTPSGFNEGDTTIVTLGNTPTTPLQNQDYIDSTTNTDVYTSDLADTATNPYPFATFPSVDQTPETAGAPVNGDSTDHRKEASDLISLAINKAIDYGDASDSSTNGNFKTKLNTTAPYANSGASHLIDTTNTLFMGTLLTDSEADGQPNAAASGDDGVGTDDEDGISSNGGTTFDGIMPPLSISATTYQVTVKVNNNTGGNAFLGAWLDFNLNGIVDPGESAFYTGVAGTVGGAAITVPAGTTNVKLDWNVPTTLAPGLRYARFRLTTDTKVYEGTNNGSATVGTLAAPIIQPNSPLGVGEVEDYVINQVPGLNLVKRITAINGTRISTFIGNTSNVVGSNTSDTKWPASVPYLAGAVDCTASSSANCAGLTGAKPGDLLEYTIYFLSNGTDDLKDVKICDRIPANTTFESATYGATSGILLGWDKTNTGALPDPTNSTVAAPKFALTNGSGDDEGEFFTAGTTLPSGPCGVAANAKGGIVVNIGPATTSPVAAATTVPAAIGAGNPIKSYGFIRFKVKVD